MSIQPSSATVSLSIDPETAKLGDPVTLTIEGIPQSTTQSSYDVTVIPSGSGIRGQTVASLQIKIFTDTCTISNRQGTWTSTSCPALDAQGKQLETFTFTGILNTNALGIDANTTTDTLFSVSVSGAGGFANKNFTVTPKAQTSSSFSISDVTPDPAEAGKNITITVSLDSDAYLAAYIPKDGSTDLEDSLSSSKFTLTNGNTSPYQLCSPPSCTFTLTVPQNTLNTQLGVYIVQLTTKAKQNKIIGLVALTPLPTGIAGPTPTPSPFPPLPPACSKWVDIETGEAIITSPNAPIDSRIIDGKAKCMEVFTAIGPISSDPSGFITTLFGIVLGLAGTVALLLIIYSGYKLLTSQGNAEAIEGARQTLTSAIVGLLFIIFTFVIFQTLTSDILKLPGF